MKKILLVLMILMLGTFAAGCQLLYFNTESVIATKVAEAVEAKISEIESAAAPVEENKAPAPSDSPTPYPTYTPYPTPVPQTYTTYNYSYVIGTPGGCLNAAFISENVPDNTVFTAGDGFIKTWTIQNTGYCTWNTNYHLVFLSGNAMSGDVYSNLLENVSPGESVTLTANLTAPGADGTYRGEWRVQSDLGINFARFWVQIVVD